MKLVVRPVIAGFLLAQLALAPGAARWTDDPLGLGAAGLMPVPPGPLANARATEPDALKAIAAHETGNAASALAHLSRLVLLHPADPALRRAYGSRLLASGAYESAYIQLMAGLRLAPEDAGLWYELAWAEAGVRKLDDAVFSAREAARLMPGWAAAHLRVGLLLFRSGEEEEALAAFARARACPSVPAEVPYEIGNVYLEQGDPAAALPYYEEALRWRPGFSFAANNMGNAYKALKETLKARRCYEAAMTADPTNPNPRNALGVLLQEQGDMAGALDAYRQAAKVAPGYPDARYNAGVLLLRTGQPKEALGELLIATRLNPGLAIAHQQVGDAQFQLGRVQEALDSYLRAMALDPNLKTKAALCERLLGHRSP